MYLKTFENCLTYNKQLAPAQYVTAPELAWDDCWLKKHRLNEKYACYYETEHDGTNAQRWVMFWMLKRMC